MRNVIECDMMNKLYKMGLHDILYQSDYEILRIPGGWVYTRFSESGAGGSNLSSVFVPFDNEFVQVRLTTGDLR